MANPQVTTERPGSESVDRRLILSLSLQEAHRSLDAQERNIDALKDNALKLIGITAIGLSILASDLIGGHVHKGWLIASGVIYASFWAL